MSGFTTSLEGMEIPVPPDYESQTTSHSAHLYVNKPLPLLPPLQPPPQLPRRSSKRKPLSIAQVPAEPNLGNQDHHAVATSPASTADGGRPSSRRTLRTPSFASGHRSSQKIHQLMGFDVNVLESHSGLFGRAICDSSEDESAGADGEAAGEDDESVVTTGERRRRHRKSPIYSDVPSLEADAESWSSRHSSGLSRASPEVQPAPLRIKSMNPDGAAYPKIHVSSSPPEAAMANDAPSWPWDWSPGRFSDVRAAGKYHRCAIDLASPATAEVFDHDALSPPILPMQMHEATTSCPSLARPQRKKPSAVATGRSIYTRGGEEVVKTPYPGDLIRPAARLRSAFDVDSDDEDGDDNDNTGGYGAKERIKKWSLIRNDERAQGPRPASRYSLFRSSMMWARPKTPNLSPNPSLSPSFGQGQPSSTSPRLSSSSRGDQVMGQVKDLFSGARNKVKGIHATKSERRRDELRKQIRVLGDVREV